MRTWTVEYRPKCGCTALQEPVDCGQGFQVYSDEIGKDLKCSICRNPGKPCGYVSNEVCTTVVCGEHKHTHLSETKIDSINLHIEHYKRLINSNCDLIKENEKLKFKLDEINKIMKALRSLDSMNE